MGLIAFAVLTGWLAAIATGHLAVGTALVQGWVVLGLGVVAVIAWRVAAETGEHEWRRIDRDWRRSGEDISDALSLEVWTRARHVMKGLRSRPRQPGPPDRARIDGERLDPLPKVSAHGGT